MSVTVEATETDEEGVWTVTVRVKNEGSVDSADYFLSASADPVEIQAEFPVSDRMTVIEDVGSLAPGEEHTTSWPVTVAPSSEWTDGAYIWFEIEPNLITAPGIARDLVFADNKTFFEFTE